MIRTVVTENSTWEFDLDAMLYRRTPRPGVDVISAIPVYTGEWEPFLGLEDYSDDQLLVIRPVPYGTGHLRHTGTIESCDGEPWVRGTLLKAVENA